MSGRCTGHCCRGFTLSVTPGELAARRSAGDAEATELLGLLLYESTRGDDERTWVRYNCRALLPNGDCSIYEMRPRMCRDYGTDLNPCKNPSCTMEVQ